MSDKNTTAISWSIEDVRSVRGDLNVEQCRKVLEALEDADANVGVNWDTIEFVASDLFGEEPEKYDPTEFDAEFAEALKPATEPVKEITIIIEAYEILSIDNIPEGVRVKVLNFDLDASLEDLKKEGKELHFDSETGEAATVSIYEASV